MRIRLKLPIISFDIMLSWGTSIIASSSMYCNGGDLLVLIGKLNVYYNTSISYMYFEIFMGSNMII